MLKHVFLSTCFYNAIILVIVTIWKYRRIFYRIFYLQKVQHSHKNIHYVWCAYLVYLHQLFTAQGITWWVSFTQVFYILKVATCRSCHGGALRCLRRKSRNQMNWSEGSMPWSVGGWRVLLGGSVGQAVIDGHPYARSLVAICSTFLL